MYEVYPMKYPTERILNPLIDKCKICNTRSVSITESATYVVNVQRLDHPDDIKMTTLVNDNIHGYTLLCLG